MQQQQRGIRTRCSARRVCVLHIHTITTDAEFAMYGMCLAIPDGVSTSQSICCTIFSTFLNKKSQYGALVCQFHFFLYIRVGEVDSNSASSQATPPMFDITNLKKMYHDNTASHKEARSFSLSSNVVLEISRTW
jgi:hypothetical protein